MREMDFQMEFSPASPAGLSSFTPTATASSDWAGLDAADLGRAVLRAAHERRIRSLRHADALWDRSSPVGLFSQHSARQAERCSEKKTSRSPIPGTSGGRA